MNKYSPLEVIKSINKMNVTAQDIFRPKSTLELIVTNYYDFIKFALWWFTIFLSVAILLIFISLPMISFGNRIPRSSSSSSSLSSSSPSSSSPITYAYNRGNHGTDALTPLLEVSREGNEFHREMYAGTEIAERFGRSQSERIKAEVTREAPDPMRHPVMM